MQLSRLTFSLASLVVLLTFGLIFAPMSVMAHPVTATNSASGEIHDGAAVGLSHDHPEIMVTIEDADPTMDGIQVVDTKADEPTTPAATDLTPTIQFDVKLTLPLGAEDGGSAVSTIAATDVTVSAYDSDFVQVGVAAGPAFSTWTQGTGTMTREWTSTVTITLADVTLDATNTADPNSPTAAEATAAREAAIAAAITAGIMSDITVVADVIQTTGLVGGPMMNQGNLRSKTTVSVVAMAVDAPPTATVTDIMADSEDLTAAITFTITLSEDVMLMASDLEVMGGSIVAGTLMQDETDPMMWTVDVRAFSGETSVTLSVLTSAVASKTSKKVPSDDTGVTGMMLADKGFLVIVRDADNPPTFGTASPTLISWADVSDEAEMPDLHKLFIENTDRGGTLQLTATVGGSALGARKAVFSEIMWAIDERLVGDAAYDDDQWIEIHNRSGADIPYSGIKIASKQGRPAPAEGTDRVSNVVGGGDLWIRTKGQNGNSGTTGTDGVTTGQKEFISMYRNRYDREGWLGRDWTKSTQLYKPNHRGTPGMKEAAGAQTFTASNVGLTTVFNEIANYPAADNSHEWIELRIKSGDPTFENWVVDMVTTAADRDVTTANPTQERLFKIPKLNKGRYDDILLITKTDPYRDDDHPLRGGYNVEMDFAAQEKQGRDKNIRYYVADDWTTDLPDSGEFVLILRHNQDRTNHERVEDLAGFVPNNPGLKVDKPTFFSNLWPLIGYPAPDLSRNQLKKGAVYRRQKDNIAGTRTTDGNKKDHTAFRASPGGGPGGDNDNGWKSVGYKRNADADAQNGGTPGYPNNAVLSNETQAGADPVIISEIMFSPGDRGNIPQWIELRNTSKTAGINLDGWRVTIVNHDQDNAAGDEFAGDLSKDYPLSGKIPPNEIFLLVAFEGTDGTNLPDERIHPLRTTRGDLILSQYGFEITLLTKGKDNVDANRKVADKVGNLATVAAGTGRVRRNPQSYEDPAWMLPMGTNDDGDRVSIVRASMMGDPINGQLEGAWNSFDMSAHALARESTHYGNRNDLSNPGYTVDGPLPVSLSKFRPERLKDTGEIVIRWITESELNNAGFNILRSETRDGEFTKLNTKLIAGQGTTSERTTYEYADTSAKPNVVYYYQIQDVSLDGQVQTLRQSRLKGNVTAAGKLTTIWGELKLQD